MSKIDLSKQNPFSSYQSDFASNFTFGPDYDSWVFETMRPALLGSKGCNEKQRLADVGAGPCYWASLFVDREPNLRIVGVDPSPDLIKTQAPLSMKLFPAAKNRLERRCQTVQDFAKDCANPEQVETFDCIYFMQSAHYVGHDEFRSVFTDLAGALNTNGRIAIQARNMTPDWYPWAFPRSWKGPVESALHATDMFARADRYVTSFSDMSETFSKVEIYERVFEVRVPRDNYWQRLEDRWISTFMNEDLIDADLHRRGIDKMKAEFELEGKSHVCWTEKFAVVIAHV